MHLSKGTFLGPYEIVDLLGAGGMAEVYRARDTRLGRIVAVKVLPPELGGRTTRRLRFEREAKIISSLNHPHICALYDVGEAPSGEGPLQYIVMEYVDGETLAHRLGKGALPIEQVLQYGIQIADALDKAHRKQILHRDLKPGNVMITKSGAKLLDFGLAKVGAVAPAFDATPPEHWQGEPTPAKPLTAEGATPGTVPYMAPEQLQGHEPDARTDVFALGVTLYEMITGRHPFEGTTQAAIIAAILQHEPPPVSRRQPLTPPALEWLVRMCLAKDRDERIQTAHDVLLELQRIDSEVKTAQPSAPRGRARWLPWAVTAGTLVAALAGGFIAWQNRAGHRPATIVRRFSVTLPSRAPLLPAASLEKFAVSPDGSRIAYVADTVPQQIFIYSLQKLEATPLPGTERALAPFFSPDGQWVGFFTIDGEVKKTSVPDGAIVTLSTGRSLRGASWSSDDRIVFGEPWAPLRRISASGGRAEGITSDAPPANVRWPSFLPDGEHILYTMTAFSEDYESDESANLAVLSLRTGKSKILVRGATYGRYVPTGHITYFRSGAIYALPFDARTLMTSGRPVPLISDVESYYGNGLAHYAIASDGALFYIPTRPADAERQLVWVDRTGRATIVTAARRPYDEPRLSPDGTRLVVTIGSGPTSDLWLYHMERDLWTRLTTVARNTTGVWSPDGSDIVFSSNRNGGFRLFRMSADGAQPPKQMTATTTWAFPLSWSPDGRDLAVVDFNRSGHSDLDVFRPETNVLAPFLRRSFNDNHAAFSPDGRWVAYQSDQSGRDEIYVQRYPEGGAAWQVSNTGGTFPVWRRDGGELFYRNHKWVMAVPIDDGRSTARKAVALFEGDFEEAFDVAPDGKRFLMVRRPQGSPQVLINVVTGLFDELKR